MERVTGYPILNLPLIKQHHIDLGFPYGVERSGLPIDRGNSGRTAAYQPSLQRDRRTVGAQRKQVIERIGALQQAGVIKRMGIIVRHHELGYRQCHGGMGRARQPGRCCGRKTRGPTLCHPLLSKTAQAPGMALNLFA